MNCCVHCLNCYCFSFQAFTTSQCIDNWHAVEACGSGCVFTYACCWTLCAPLFIDCQFGSRTQACRLLNKGCKYFFMGCSLSFVSSLDGLCNCFRICGRICGQDKIVTKHHSLVQPHQFFGHKIETYLKLYHSEGPKSIMHTFTP